MGNKQTRFEIPKLRKSELNEFSKQSLLDPSVVEYLYSHYYRISYSKTEDGVIDLSEFCFKTQNKENSLIAERVFSMFDTNHDGVINFREFVLGISVFSDSKNTMIRENSRMEKVRLKDKIDYSVRIFLGKAKNKTYVKDVRSLFVSLIEEKKFLNLSRRQIKQIVKKTFKTDTVKTDDEGEYWDTESYAKMAMENPQIFKWLSVNLNDLQIDGKVLRNIEKCISA